MTFLGLGVGVTSGRSVDPGIVLDAARKGSNVVLSNGNRRATNAAAEWESVVSTQAKSGKRYFEILVNVGIVASGQYVGIAMAKAGADMENFLGADANGLMYINTGAIYYNGATPWGTAFTTFTTNSVVGCAVDIDNDSAKFNVNGGAFSADLTGWDLGASAYAGMSLYGGGSATIALKAAHFAHAIPSGYSAWDS